jgi:hypothetical protein
MKAGTPLAGVKAPDGKSPAAGNEMAPDCSAEKQAPQQRAEQQRAALKSCSEVDDRAKSNGARPLAAGSLSAAA